MGDIGAAVAVVTGASSGLGRRFALALAQKGATVALMARREEEIRQLADEIEAGGRRAVAIRLDVSDPAAISVAMDEAERCVGPISILVNNAGVAGAGRALEMDAETFDRTFAVNVRAPFFAAREAARRMIDSGVAADGRGRIVNVGSIAALKSLPGLSAYCASKAALVSMTKTLAFEWARYGISVNALCPGYVETEMNRDWFASEQGGRQIQGFPRRRLLDGGALDESLLLLCGPAAAAMTGSVLVVDDGQSLS